MLALVDFDEPNFALLERFDWWGLAFMAGFLGSLEYVLEEGPRNEWLQDTSVGGLRRVMRGLGDRVLLAGADGRGADRRHQRPSSDRNFGIGCLISFCVGIGLYGLTYMYPRYLAEVRGYNALMIGETMFVSGVASSCTAPIVGRLMRRVDMRLMIAIGLVHVRARLLADDLASPRSTISRSCWCRKSCAASA